MFNHHKWHILQLFAGEGGAAGASGSAGGDGASAAGSAATGDTSADAGHQRLRELGVPESRIRKPRAKQAPKLPEGAIRTQEQAQQPAKQAAAADEQTAQTEAAPARMSWDEIMKDPEYNQHMQDIIKARLKDEKATLETLTPAIKHLAQEHGLDPENVDYTALVKAVTGEYEDKALEMGVSKQTAMELDRQQRTLEQQKVQNHISKLEQQGEAMKAIYPDFDLRKELEDPRFVRLTSPSVGLSVEDAYYAIHRREIQARDAKMTQQQTAQAISNAIQSGTHRPDEAGTRSQAPSVSTFDYKNATPAQRKAIKDEIRRAAAEGRKVYPGRL